MSFTCNYSHFVGENGQILIESGIFALSGAITNWFAVHMLFEKVPGLYGSGIIPSRFEEFKNGIKIMLMNQFFTDENIHKFLGNSKNFNLSEEQKVLFLWSCLCCDEKSYGWNVGDVWR